MNEELYANSKKLTDNNIHANIGQVLYTLSDELNTSTENAMLDLCENTDEQTEVLEWWLVSDYLCEKLKEHGEVVIPWLQVWGRQTTGQSVYIDKAILDIVKENEGI